MAGSGQRQSCRIRPPPIFFQKEVPVAQLEKVRAENPRKIEGFRVKVDTWWTRQGRDAARIAIDRLMLIQN